MGCCGSGAELTATPPDARTSDKEILLASRIVADGIRQTELAVPTIHCGACVRTIEKALGGLVGVESVRANLSTKRVTVRWQSNDGPPPFVETLQRAGWASSPLPRFGALSSVRTLASGLIGIARPFPKANRFASRSRVTDP